MGCSILVSVKEGKSIVVHSYVKVKSYYLNNRGILEIHIEDFSVYFMPGEFTSFSVSTLQ